MPTIERKIRFDETTGQIYHSSERKISAAFDEEKGYLFWARKNFSKQFQGINFPKEMTMQEIGQMTVLAKKIWSNTNMLGYRGNGGIKPMNISHIAKTICLKDRQTRNFLNKMIKLGVIARVDIETDDRKETQFYINPLYFFSSSRLPLNLYLIFRESLDQHLPEWVIERFGKEELQARISNV